MADMSKVKLPDNSIYNLRDDRFIYEKSVSASNVATFSDGADNVPLKSLTLDINPTQSGSGDPAPDNIRPITGVSSVNLYRTGKNLIGMSSLNKGSVVVTDGVATGTSNQFKSAFDTPDGFLPNFPFKPNTVYSFSADVKYEVSTSTSYGLNIRALYTDGTFENMKRIPLNTPDYVRVGGVSASNKTLKAIYCAYNSGANNQLWMKNVQIEEASLPTDYEAYQGNTYLIQLGDTYYGGVLDIDEDGNVKLMVWGWYHTYTTATLYGNYGPDNAPLYYFETDNPNIVPAGNATQNGKLICNYFKKTTGATSLYLKNNEIRTQESANSNRLFFRWDDAASLSDINTAFSTKPLQVILELATPIEIDLTPKLLINALLGQNHIWHDANGTTACTYRVDTPLVDAIKDISPEITIDDTKTVTDQTWSSNKIASEISSATAGVIDDTTTDTDTTWSSSKISTELATKTEVDDATASATKTYSSNKIEDIIEAITPRTGTVTDQAVATFSDGADNVPLKSLTLDINPVQDLHGYDSPWAGGAGKNICDISTWTGHTGETSPLKNPIPANTQITISALFTRTPDAGSQCSVVFYYTDGTNGQTKAFDVGTGERQSATITTNKEVKSLYFYSINGSWSQSQSYTLTVTDLMIEKSSSATSYAPYENICPITGVSSVNVARTGKNLAYIQNSTLYPRGDGLPIAENANTRTCYARVPKNTNIVITKAESTNRNIVYGIDGEPAVGVLCHSLTYTNSGLSYFVNTGNYEYIGFYFGNESVNIMIELGSTASDYSAYQGNTYLIQLGGTYYGATLDVVRGKLKVTNGYIDFADMAWTKSSVYFVSESIKTVVKKPTSASEEANSICTTYPNVSRTALNSKDVAYCIDNNGNVDVRDSAYSTKDEFVAGTNGVKLCYELATPIEIDLTPTQVNSLLGQNNIWHDGNGNTSCEYYKTGCEPIARLIEVYTDRPIFSNGTLFN